MAKYKPNDLCFCGSGKKYKKCHRAISQTEKNQPSADFVSQVPKLKGTWGLSGTEIGLSILRFNSNDPNAPMNSAHPGGKEGFYKVEFVLSRPMYPALAENLVSFDLSNVNGDSHIFLGVTEQIAEGEEEFSVVIFEANLPEENFSFYGYPNERGFLSKIVAESIKAHSFQNAQVKAYNALAPTLSRLSLLLDVPLNISNTVINELSTDNYMSSVKLPYIEKTPLVFENYQLHTVASKFASLYREALNSNSPNYQFLCFYKIIEGIRQIRRERATKENEEARAKGEKPVRKVELIPSDREGRIELLNFCFTPQNWSDMAIAQVFPQSVVGRKVSSLINPNSKLDMIRNQIAHATGLRDESQETFNFDNGSHIAEVHNWLPFCKFTAIYLLKTDFPFLFR